MKIRVLVKLKAKIGKIEKISANRFNIWVKEAPVEGKANQAVIKMLADYFDVAPSRIRIVSGHSAKRKVVEII